MPGITVLNHAGDELRRRLRRRRPPENGRYRRWIAASRAAIGTARVIIAFEPDSLGTLKCLRRPRPARAPDNMKSGIDVLSQLPNATVYVEATASDWRPAREVARYLRYVGIHRVRGFMLNVTHQDNTRNNVRYGQRLSRMVGGKHFVVNTAENGHGRLFGASAGRRKRNFLVHCNPKNSSLGHPPTTTVDHQRPAAAQQGRRLPVDRAARRDRAARAASSPAATR